MADNILALAEERSRGTDLNSDWFDIRVFSLQKAEGGEPQSFNAGTKCHYDTCKFVQSAMRSTQSLLQIKCIILYVHCMNGQVMCCMGRR